MRRFRLLARLSLFVALLGLALLAPSPAHADVYVFTDSDVELGVHNNDGDWWIAKQCLGSQYFGYDGNGSPLTTGPGYVESFIDNAGRLLVDDWAKPLVIPGRGVDTWGGFGSFGYHHARGNPWFTFDGGNSWATGTRVCDYDMSGYGVARSWVAEGPTKYGGGPDAPLYWSIYVDLKTPYKDPFIRILYRYQFHLSTIKVWVRLFNQCAGSMNCGDPDALHFAKEPKFVAETNQGAGFNRVCVFDSASNVLTRWSGAEPPERGTGQTYGDDRARARFDFGGTNACASPSCPCLNAVGRSYPAGWEPNGPTWPWESSSYGLDHWAVQADSNQAAHWDDSPAGGADWDCHYTPGSSLNRSWEQVGWGGGWYGGTYYPPHPFSNYFLGWKGGTGNFDCEPLSRTMLYWDEVQAHLQFSYDTGWEMQRPEDLS
jgi:hypothetical protein